MSRWPLDVWQNSGHASLTIKFPLTPPYPFGPVMSISLLSVFSLNLGKLLIIYASYRPTHASFPGYFSSHGLKGKPYHHRRNVAVHFPIWAIRMLVSHLLYGVNGCRLSTLAITARLNISSVGVIVLAQRNWGEPLLLYTRLLLTRIRSRCHFGRRGLRAFASFVSTVITLKRSHSNGAYP